MKKFQKFLEELELKDTSGFPEGYLKAKEDKAKSDIRERGERRGRTITGRSAVSEMMSATHKLNELSRGKEKELEKLAKKVITDYYGPVIEAYDIKLDIKIYDQEELKSEAGSRDFWNYNKVKHFDEEEMKGKRPVVVARGIDFSMLLHEAVKGIWMVLSSNAIPKDKALAAKIKRAITPLDEPEDWRYGPSVAADLRDFVNENPNIDKFPNTREFLWELMTNEKTMPANEFVELFKGILGKTPEARKKVDSLINQVIREMDSYNKELQRYKRELEEYNRKLAEWEAYQAEKELQDEEAPEEGPVIPSVDTTKYDNMTERELDHEIDAALDEGDFELLALLSDIKQNKFGDE